MASWKRVRKGTHRAGDRATHLRGKADDLPAGFHVVLQKEDHSVLGKETGGRFYETLPKRSRYDFLRLDNSFRKSPLRYLYAVQNDGPSIYSHRMGDLHDTTDRPSSRRSSPEQRMIPASSQPLARTCTSVAHHHLGT